MSTEKVEKKPDYSINNSDVVAKYKLAGDIASQSLAHVKSLIKPGSKVFDICVGGDEFIESKLSDVYNNRKTKKISKGIAFPTSVSPNNIAAYLSPIASTEESNFELKEGDVVKIQLGAQIDGFASILADTIVVGKSEITGRAADAIAAAFYASEAAIRTIKPGNRNWDVTSIVEKLVKNFECVPLEGMLSHNQEKDVLIGPKEIIINPSESQKSQVSTCTFEEGEVYGLDILVSTGNGSVKQANDVRTTIYKLTGNNYKLKLKASHAVLGEVKQKASQFPFSIRNLDEPAKGRMGLVECCNHNVMINYDVMQESADALVAQVYTTFAITKNGTVKFASASPDMSLVKTDKSISDEKILELLKQPLKAKKAKKTA